MTYQEGDLKVGMTVKARLFGGVPTTGKIIDTGYKNERSLIDLDNGHWCYVSQVYAIVKEDEREHA